MPRPGWQRRANAAWGTASYTNDANGNTLTDGASNRSMAWDAQNRMASCTYAGQTSTFTYGADGLRRRMVTGNKTVDTLLDGQSVVRELTTENGQQNTTATYLVGPRGPEYKRDQNGVVSWYLYDGLGSVVGLVDASGNVTNTRKYDVYGAPRNAQTGSAHCFVGGLGHTSDAETGLIYMRARYCDPAAGRFVSEDPARDGTNWMVYGRCDPVNMSDPSGEETQWARVAGYCSLILLGIGASKIFRGLLLVAGIALLVSACAPLVLMEMMIPSVRAMGGGFGALGIAIVADMLMTGGFNSWIDGTLIKLPTIEKPDNKITRGWALAAEVGGFYTGMQGFYGLYMETIGKDA